MQDESDLRAALHKDTLFEVLQFYGKDFLNVACLIGDNWSTNECLARNKILCFIGCASYWLNLGVKSVPRSYESLLSKIRNIMVFLRGLKPRSKLRHVLNVRPVLSTVTRWSSIKNMSWLIDINSSKLFWPTLFLPVCSFCRPKTV